MKPNINYKNNINTITIPKKKPIAKPWGKSWGNGWGKLEIRNE